MRQTPPVAVVPVDERMIRVWIAELFRRCGVRTVILTDGSFGVMNLDGRSCRVVEALTEALFTVAEKDKLPEFAPEEKKKRK